MWVDCETSSGREPEEFPVTVLATEHTVPDLEPIGLRPMVQFVVLFEPVVSPFRVPVLETSARARECLGSLITPSTQEAC